MSPATTLRCSTHRPTARRTTRVASPPTPGAGEKLAIGSAAPFTPFVSAQPRPEVAQ
jgi:hypothetical protein